MASTTASRLLSAVSGRRCLLTVGTTNFDALIRHLDTPTNAHAFLSHLSSLHFSHLTIQLGGTSRYTPTHLPTIASQVSPPLTVDLIHLAPSLASLLSTSALVISHAGAGSIVEALRLRLPLLVVVNEQLMDNHQLQLARALAGERFLYMATVGNVLQVVQALDEGRLSVKGEGKEGDGEEDEEDEEEVDESRWGKKGDVVYVDYQLRPYPPATSQGFLAVLEEELDLS